MVSPSLASQRGEAAWAAAGASATAAAAMRLVSASLVDVERSTDSPCRIVYAAWHVNDLEVKSLRFGPLVCSDPRRSSGSTEERIGVEGMTDHTLPEAG